MTNHRLINEYEAPTPDDLQALKNELNYTGAKMADLAGVFSSAQWRKYTNNINQRKMAPQMLFYLAAQLALTPEELDRIIKKMVEIGARINHEPEPAE